jgi:hypothetical protein
VVAQFDQCILRNVDNVELAKRREALPLRVPWITRPARMKLARYLWALLDDMPAAFASAESVMAFGSPRNAASRGTPTSIDWIPALSEFVILQISP